MKDAELAVAVFTLILRCDINNPEYEDLFLDVVIPSKGHIYHMDDIELMKAKNEGLVSDEDYKLCKTVCRKLESYFEDNRQELLSNMTCHEPESCQNIEVKDECNIWICKNNIYEHSKQCSLGAHLTFSEYGAVNLECNVECEEEGLLQPPVRKKGQEQ